MVSVGSKGLATKFASVAEVAKQIEMHIHMLGFGTDYNLLLELVALGAIRALSPQGNTSVRHGDEYLIC